MNVLMPSTKVSYQMTEHSAVIIDIIELSMLIDDWYDELEEQDERGRDREITKRLMDWLNTLSVEGAPYKFTRSDAVKFLLGLPGDVDLVKKKLQERQPSSPPTEPTSFPTHLSNIVSFGSSTTKSSPTENSTFEAPMPPSPASD